MFELATPRPRYQPSFLAAADEFLAAGEDRYARIPDIRQDAFFEACPTRVRSSRTRLCRWASPE